MELYLREGPFWKAISAMRAKWKITPTVGLPPEPLPTPQLTHSDDTARETRGENPCEDGYYKVIHPIAMSRERKLRRGQVHWFSAEQAREFAHALEPVTETPSDRGHQLQRSPNDDPFDERYGQWHSDVERLALLLGRGRFYRAADWKKFAEACVLYDPPPGRDKLVFAEYGGINVRRADGRDVFGEGSDGEGRRTAAPLVRWVPNLAQRDRRMQDYYQGIIDGLAERYEAATGKDAAEAIEEIIRERGLEEQRRAARVDHAPAIFPDEHSTKDEAHAAHNAIRRNPGGGRVSGLVAVVCAELLDEHNARDPEDRRFKAYTHKKLASEFGSYGVDNERSARHHAARGRELRAIRERNLKES